MSLPVARTVAEAHVFMAMSPCGSCGADRFRPATDGIVEVDGELVSWYGGVCPGCRRRREFSFRLPPEETVPDPEDPRFGGDEPSRLLDAGQWVDYADRLVAGIPAEPAAALPPAERAVLRQRIRNAAAAIAEALKFAPEGAEAVPREALWSTGGQATYLDRPERFDRLRLEAVRRAYRELAERYG